MEYQLDFERFAIVVLFILFTLIYSIRYRKYFAYRQKDISRSIFQGLLFVLISTVSLCLYENKWELNHIIGYLLLKDIGDIGRLGMNPLFSHIILIDLNAIGYGLTIHGGTRLLLKSIASEINPNTEIFYDARTYGAWYEIAIDDTGITYLGLIKKFHIHWQEVQSLRVAKNGARQVGEIMTSNKSYRFPLTMQNTNNIYPKLKAGVDYYWVDKSGKTHEIDSENSPLYNEIESRLKVIET